MPDWVSSMRVCYTLAARPVLYASCQVSNSRTAQEVDVTLRTDGSFLAAFYGRFLLTRFANRVRPLQPSGAEGNCTCVFHALIAARCAHESTRILLSHVAQVWCLRGLQAAEGFTVLRYVVASVRRICPVDLCCNRGCHIAHRRGFLLNRTARNSASEPHGSCEVSPAPLV
jgi:hypothetical protein